MLPDRSVSIGQKLVENAKAKKIKCDILSDFQTMWACAFRHLGKAAPPLKSKAKKEVKCKFPFHNCFYIVAPLEEGSLKSPSFDFKGQNECTEALT